MVKEYIVIDTYILLASSIRGIKMQIKVHPKT